MLQRFPASTIGLQVGERESGLCFFARSGGFDEVRAHSEPHEESVQRPNLDPPGSKILGRSRDHPLTNLFQVETGTMVEVTLLLEVVTQPILVLLQESPNRLIVEFLEDPSGIAIDTFGESSDSVDEHIADHAGVEERLTIYGTATANRESLERRLCRFRENQ